MSLRHLNRVLQKAVCGGLLIACSTAALAADIRFERIQLSSDFYAEGGTAGDLDADGHGDVVVGPWIYWGPDYANKSRFYEGDAIDPVGYSANFVAATEDIDGDKLLDMLVVGFPGAESWWYRNPGKDKSRSQLWQRHTILDVVDNESPLVADLDGDGVKDLICSSKGSYGFASHAGQDPTQVWKFTAISPNNNYHRYTHGLGIGDVNNDNRMDLLEKDGWWENPGPRSGDAAKEPWKFHKVTLAAPGGSQMFAIDLDGDRKNEILTGLSAHGFGLVYYRVLDAAKDQLEKVEIMTADAKSSPVGLAISQLHAVDVADINRDGIPDIVTGKRWWAHATGDDGSHMPASLVWLETQRAGGRVRFVPHVIDNSSGVGTQIMAVDVNGDKLLDIVAGNKRGAYLFLQIPADWPADKRYVERDPFEQRPANQSVAIEDAVGGFRPALNAGQPLNFDFESGKAGDWEVRGPIRTSLIQPASDGAHGKFMATSASSEKDKSAGELISRPFKLTHPWLSALVAGGKAPAAGVEVVSEASGQVLGRLVGTEGEQLERQWLDLSPHVGTLVRVRLVDHVKNPGVAATLDDVRLHSQKP